MIDLESGYAPVIHPAEDRSGETWHQTLDVFRRRGLSPELSVNDGGSGLARGLKMTYPDIAIQPDVFHLLREMGRETKKAEKMALSKLGEYCKLEYEIFYSRKRSGKHGWGNYWTLRAEIEPLLHCVDSLNILYEWLKESVSLTGYGYEKSLSLCEWILDEMAALFPERKKLQKAITNFRVHLADILSFLRRLQAKMENVAETFQVTGHDFMLLGVFPNIAKTADKSI